MTKRYQPHQEFSLPKRPVPQKPTSWWCGLSEQSFAERAKAAAARMRLTATSTAHVVEAIGSRTRAEEDE